MTKENEKTSRRNWLKGSAAVGAAAFAGCLGGDGPEEDEHETLELAHWWTPEAARAAMDALQEGFLEEYPEHEIDDRAVAGGAGDALQTVIRQRVLERDPPGTWQAWPGANLMPYVEADVLQDIEEEVWDENDMKDAYLQGPMDAARPGGQFVTVPLNIHRINNLFYSIPVLEDAGVDPQALEDPQDLIEALETLDAAGYIGLPHQTAQPWATLQLWANVLLGISDAATYESVMDGDVSGNEDAVREALELTSEMSEYFPDDSSSLDWPQAQNYLINEEGGFHQQGDWAGGNLIEDDDMEFQEDWDMIPFPGTGHMYMLNMDSFPAPQNSPSPQATLDWCRYCGTVDAQERFNPLKGSIPPRTDVPSDNFNPFLQRQMDDFENSDVQPVSVAHGLAVPPDQHSDMESAIANFMDDWNVDDAYDEIVDALE